MERRDFSRLDGHDARPSIVVANVVVVKNVVKTW